MKKIYEIDLDGTLCTNTDGAYGLAEPLYENIQKVNALYEQGNTININTGRGSTTGIDWYDLTEAQLKEWGIKFHSLTCGKKPYYDYIIDDKAINAMKEKWENV
jgi:hydroxymethylpyrimidine pyrophosphatase-like HAD family hydrolase